MHDAITYKLPNQISWGWSGIELKRLAERSPIQKEMTFKVITQYNSVSVNSRKFCNFTQNPRPMLGHFTLSRNILGKKLPFL